MADNNDNSNSTNNSNNNNSSNSTDRDRDEELWQRFAALPPPPQDLVAPAAGRGGGDRSRGRAGGRGESGRGRGGPAYNQPRFCNCGNRLGPQDRTKCAPCRGAFRNFPAANQGYSGQLSGFAGGLQQAPNLTGRGEDGSVATAAASLSERGERGREGRREREERERRPGRSASPDRRSRREVAHLTAQPGRVVDQPCRGCLRDGREHAAQNHYDHECMHKDSLGRRSARRRFNAQQSPPAPPQQ